MINSETAVANLALNAIGDRDNIASLDEVSRQAEVCKLWFSPVRDQLLASAVWPEATKLAYLALLNENDGTADWVDTNARPGYAYAYGLPADYLHPQYLSNYERFLINSYPGDRISLASNAESAILVYTWRNSVVATWSSSLQMAMVYALASHIAMPLMGKAGRAKELADKANNIIWAAREKAANTSNDTLDFIPDWIAGRGYSSGSSAQNFIYPLGDVFMSTSNVN